MDFADSIRIALRRTSANQMRSAQTVLGLKIGVVAALTAKAGLFVAAAVIAGTLCIEAVQSFQSRQVELGHV